MPHNPPFPTAPLRPLAMALAGLLLSSASWAATFVVNDLGDAPLGGAMCTGVPNPCTLRAAIQAANANADADTIQFDFSGGQVTISPTSALPPIVNPVTIDGYALDAGYPNTMAVGHNAIIRIRIDGLNAGPNVPGLVFLSGASNSMLRGVAITRFGAHGVMLSGQNIANSLIEVSVTGNFIGTDGTGVGDDATGLLANAGSGIFINDLARNVTVGGDLPAERNLIVAHGTQTGVALFNAPQNQIRNNYIGTNRAGDSRRATAVGVSLHSTTATVDSNILGASNLGVFITGDSGATTYSVLQSNRIGVGTDGAAITAPGSQHGVYIINAGTASPQRVKLGGADPGEGNVIAHWGGDGIRVERNAAAAPDLRYHQWAGNSIYSNGGLGIELIDTATGLGAGPMSAAPSTVNASQRYPLVLGATGNAAGTLVTFEFAGASNASYRMEVFANATCDASNFGEGQTYLGAVEINTDAGGTYTGTAALPAVPAGSRVTMTATRDYNDNNMESSEFSQCIAVAAGPGGGSSVTAVPTLGHLGLILLSTLLGAMGLRARGRG